MKYLVVMGIKLLGKYMQGMERKIRLLYKNRLLTITLAACLLYKNFIRRLSV